MDKESWVIDRFEGAYAVIEDSSSMTTFDCPLSDLPAGVKEGDVLRKDPSGKYFADAEETKRRKARARGLMDRLKKRQRL